MIGRECREPPPDSRQRPRRPRRKPRVRREPELRAAYLHYMRCAKCANSEQSGSRRAGAAPHRVRSGRAGLRSGHHRRAIPQRHHDSGTAFCRTAQRLRLAGAVHRLTGNLRNAGVHGHAPDRRDRDSRGAGRAAAGRDAHGDPRIARARGCGSDSGHCRRGVSRNDPWTIAGAGIVFLLTAAIAAALPARRATGIDPVRALRPE